MEKTKVVEDARTRTAAAIEAVENASGVPAPGTIRRLHRDDRPDPAWVRGRCPECGDDLVSNMYYIGGRGYLIRWECWNSLGEDPACRYYKVL